jgi:hypothetical protein
MLNTVLLWDNVLLEVYLIHSERVWECVNNTNEEIVVGSPCVVINQGQHVLVDSSATPDYYSSDSKHYIYLQILIDEISKCNVYCSNHHMMVTNENRRNNI